MTLHPIRTMSPHLVDAARALTKAERQTIRARVSILAALEYLAEEERALQRGKA